MSDCQTGLPDRYRALKAATIVLALLLMVPGIDALFHVASGRFATELDAGRIDSRELVMSDDPYAALERIEELAESTDAQVPDAFAREIGFPPGAADIRVDETGTVVGYSVAEDADCALDGLKEHMESLGWTAVPLGGEKGATFVKSSGACTWALATCTQIGDGTSVVMRCMYS